MYTPVSAGVVYLQWTVYGNMTCMYLHT